MTSAQGSDESGTSRRRSIGSGRAGPLRAGVRKVVAEARAAGRMTAEHEVRALVAERYAAIVDTAAAAGDTAGLLRAADKLVELLDTLPIRAGGEPGDSGSDDRGQLLRVLDSPAAVGDSPDA